MRFWPLLVLLQAVLQLPATSAFDMWSAGCVLYEAATGSPLFEIEEGDEWSAEEHHLWMIKELTGQPSLKVGPTALTADCSCAALMDHH